MSWVQSGHHVLNFPTWCFNIYKTACRIWLRILSITLAAAAAAKSLQSCPTLCSPIDGSPPGSPVPGILQARTLEWAAISFSSAWEWKVKVKSLSRVWLLATPWTAANQAPLSMGFSRQEYWSGVPLCSPILSLSWYNKYYILLFGTRLIYGCKTWYILNKQTRML